MMISFDFNGRHAVVTGAGGGMGEEIAHQYLTAGGSVTAIDVKPCPERLKEFGARLNYVQGDLTDGASVHAAIDGGAARFGRLDHLANVAGVLWFGRDKSLFDMDMETWDKVFDINLKSMLYTIRAATPHIRKGGTGGAMVHFSTIQWMRGDRAPQDAYQASKAAVCAMSKSVAMQLAGENIRSNAICPGATVTPLQARWDSQEKLDRVAGWVPLGKIGTPRDMSNAALFLLSDGAGYITGIELAVDGGTLML
jgi:NAD(P)-dependent dehydrogenase (short-subunit alcohol dehydrogenase family)